ncbi:DotH/IcmK family type IV secretion protein [Klebsiella sp. PL-2018]|uniref:DotH/IcmK family type IV secretion protein n=1 Tax=Klebsiella TaxID=570 RepID=UPI001C23D7A6|nr:DotH/IcmK family type IV secretion protein [Klebsiella sp. PL-2018]QXD00990.1 IncI1 plasmid conjugative transfer protein TraN [Klebsiella sp. PL-2018]
MRLRSLLCVLLMASSMAATAAETADSGWRPARGPQTGAPAGPNPHPDSVPADRLTGDVPVPSGNSADVIDAARLDAALSPDEIRTLRGMVADNERAVSSPVTSVVPRISSLTVNLSPGASLPLVRTAVNNLSVVTFSDINGTPWPQSDPPYNAAPGFFDVQYNGNMVTITPTRPWAAGNVSVYLKGLAVPVILNVNSGETDTPAASQETDSRLDLRIPRQGPGSPRADAPAAKIALHDTTLQAFLDGIPPKDPTIRRLRFTGNLADTTVWQQGDNLIVRSRAMLRDEFEQTLSSADGTHVWKLPLSPLLTFSVEGRSVHITPDLESS